jgi:K+-transporting ATPase ATPase A chain
MTLQGWILITVYVLVLLAITKPFGAYLFQVFEGARQPFPRVLGRLEHWAYRLGGVDPRKEQTWTEYAFSVLVFSAVTLLVTYALLRLQHALPLNPAGFGGVGPDLAWNTAVSFTTNTNWQSYGGESTMSYLSQMAALVWHNFLSAGVGLGVGLALARGLTRRPGPDGPRTLGNFWVDLVRSLLYVFLPICIVVALVLVSQGMLQNLAAYREVTTLEGAKRVLAMGPTASQLVIKMFGINGGGFFNANSAHPFENPTPFTNFVEMLLIFAIPSALTYTYGRMAKDQRQGWALWIAMAFLFIAGVAVIYWAEAHASPALHALGIDPALGNMEGKEVRFGVADSSLFATITTDASCGAVNAMHDSFSPLGGLVTLLNIQLGEVIFGGVGAGLYGVLVFGILAVFIAGLMVGRTPEYLGKKIEAREIKLAMLYILVFPLIILGFSAWAAVATFGTVPLTNHGPHGLSEILYAFSSGAGNNGSAFGGLNANTPFYDVALGLTMLAGRFWMAIPVLAIAGSMIGKKTVAPGLGTFPTNGIVFTGLLVAVILIVGALTFFPALSLGPVVEHYLAAAGRTYP